MTFRDQVRQEISVKVAELAANGRPLVPDWIAHEICNAHTGGLNEDSDEAMFWRQGGYHAVRAETGQYLRKSYSAEAAIDDGRQHTLPGFDHVQTHYIVARDGDEIAVPTPDLSSEEVSTIIRRIRSAGVALLAHADELERWERARAVPPLIAALSAMEKAI